MGELGSVGGLDVVGGSSPSNTRRKQMKSSMSLGDIRAPPKKDEMQIQISEQMWFTGKNFHRKKGVDAKNHSNSDSNNQTDHHVQHLVADEILDC